MYIDPISIAQAIIAVLLIFSILLQQRASDFLPRLADRAQDRMYNDVELKSLFFKPVSG